MPAYEAARCISQAVVPGRARIIFEADQTDRFLCEVQCVYMAVVTRYTGIRIRVLHEIWSKILHMGAHQAVPKIL